MARAGQRAWQRRAGGGGAGEGARAGLHTDLWSGGPPGLRIQNVYMCLIVNLISIEMLYKT